MAAEPWGASLPEKFGKDQPVLLAGGGGQWEILEVLDLPLCLWRPGGTVHYANPAFLALSGHSAEDLAGLQFYSDLCAPPELAEIGQGALSGSLVHFSGMRRAQGGVAWVKVNRRAVMDPLGRVKYYVASVNQAPGPEVVLPREQAAPAVDPADEDDLWEAFKARLLRLPRPLIDPDNLSPADLHACLRDCLDGLTSHHLVDPSGFDALLSVPDRPLPRETGLFLAEAALDILHFSLPWDEEEQASQTLNLEVARDEQDRLLLRVFARGEMIAIKPKPKPGSASPLNPLARRVIARGGSLLIFNSDFREIRVTLPA